MKYVINDNVNVIIADFNKLEEIIYFQDNVLKDISDKNFFKPLTKLEFSDAIINGKIYLLYYNNRLIGLGVLNSKPRLEVIDEYQLVDINSVGILDSVMIDKDFRGSKLQKQLINYMEADIKKCRLRAVVATVHPNNIWSLNNLLSCNFKIINKIIIHGGDRYILIKIY